MDRIEELIRRLETALPDYTWDRDALDMERGDKYGAVELSGIAATLWADDQPVERAWTIQIWMAMEGSGLESVETVEAVLEAFDSEVAPIVWDMPQRGYYQDIGKLLWNWRVTLYGPPVTEDAEPDPAPDSSGTEGG